MGRDTRVKTEWWQKKRTCLRCGSEMEPGMLPGYFNCRGCKLWIDIQTWSGGAIIQYAVPGLMRSEPVPQGTLLVLSGDEA